MSYKCLQECQNLEVTMYVFTSRQAYVSYKSSRGTQRHVPSQSTVSYLGHHIEYENLVQQYGYIKMPNAPLTLFILVK